MKRFSLLAACAFVAAVLVALVWFVSKSGSPTPVDTAARTDHSSAAEPSPSALATNEDEPTALDGALDAAESQSGDVASRSAAPDLLRTLVVRGRVRAPSMCEDPTLEVLACTRALDPDTVESWTSGDVDARPDMKAILARAPVAADGTFEVALPDDTKRAFFTLAGRFLYVRKPAELDVSGDARTIEIDADVGAWVQGEIGMPAESPVTAAELDGTPVRMRTSVEDFIGGGDPSASLQRKAHIASGRFEFRAVPVGAKYRVFIEPEKLAAAAAMVSDLKTCEPRTLPIPLLRGGTVRGVVRGSDKNPIEGAEVEASVAGKWFGFDNRDVRSAKSAADGTFELTAVTPGEIVMTATKDGMLDSEKVKIDLADGGVTSGVEIELPRGNSIAGRVTFADGAPALGANVRVNFDMSQMYGMNAFNAARGAEGKATTSSDGTFEVWGLGQGPFSVHAEGSPADAPTDLVARELEKHKARVDGITPNAKAVELVLHAPIGLRGRVVDANGAPVQKFRLYAVRPSDGLMGNFGQEQHEESFDAEDGHFLFAALETGKWELFAIADGFAYPDAFALTLPRDDVDGEVVITLVLGAVVRGHVRDASGAPVSGASIEINTGEPSWKARVVAGPKKPGATSGDDGVFALASLSAGHVALVADAKEHAKSLPIELDLVAGTEAKDVDFVLRAGGTLTGEVFDDTGEPASGLMVQLTDPQNFEQQMAFSDGRGTFKFEHLEPASWQVVAIPTSLFQSAPKADDGATSDNDMAMSMFSKMKMAMVDIKDGEETHIVLGAPPTDPVRVFGRVTHHGEPFTGSMVIFYREGKASLAGMKSVQVDKDGNYSLVIDTAGPYLASVQKFAGSMQQQSVVEYSCDIPTEKEYRLDFAMPTARISGRIRDVRGDAAKGARVTLHPETAIEGGTMWGGQYNELSADDDGRFDIQALRPGRYTLLVGGMSFGGLFGNGESVMGREVKSGIALSEGEWMRDVDFRLKTPGSLEVSVVDGADVPLSEAAVFVRTENGELVDRFSMVSTDARGSAVYGGLAPGRYTVTARKGLLVAPESARFSVGEGAKTPVKITLGGGTTIVVTLVGEPEKPLKPSVSVTDEEGRELSSMLGLAELMKMFSEGGLSMTERRFGPFPPGRYTIKGTANGKTVTKTVQLTGQAERKLTLRFND